MSIATRTKPQMSPSTSERSRMTTLAKPQVRRYEEPSFEYVQVTQEHITACFSDDRIVSVPLWWSWRLEQATPQQREHYEIIGAGRTVYWPDLDEHLSVQGFFIGTPAPRPKKAPKTP
ncbi:MAG: DUF2442 domain-containing protein [Ardenticatenaceae bacterium]